MVAKVKQRSSDLDDNDQLHYGGGFETNYDSNLKTSKTDQGGVTASTYLYALCAALNSVNLGYDLGTSTNSGPLIQQDFGLEDWQLELFLGSLNFWSIFGALLSPLVTDRYGRRMTFLAAAVGFIIGVAVMASAQNYTVLMIGRMVVGLGVGVGEAIDPMYIAEIAPASHRGELVSWAEAGVAVGVVLGFLSSLFFRTESVDGEWRSMLALGAVMPVVMIGLVLFVMPESPRWLVAKKDLAGAKQVLSRIYLGNVDQVIGDIQDSLALEQEASSAVGWEAILWRPSPAVRRMLVVGVGVAIIQQAVGIDSIMFYMMFVIDESGIHSDSGQITALVVLGTIKLLFVFVGAKLFDRLGRRPLFFTSLIGMAGSLILVACTFAADSQASNVTMIVGLGLYLAFFSTGLGPGNWVVVSEVFALSIRAKAMSVAVFPNRVTATLMASTFLSTAKAITWPGFFILLAVVCLVSAAFLYVYLPETSGRSLEEMSLYFAEITGDRSILDVEERLQKARAQEIELTEASSPSSSALDDDSDDRSAMSDESASLTGGVLT